MISRLLLGVLVWLSFSANVLAASKSQLVITLTPHPGGTEMMTLHATVRGHEGNFIFDTGGGISYISPAFAQTIGCKMWGQITGFTLVGQRLDMPRCDGLSFEIQGRSFGAPESGIFDIMKFMPPNVPKIDGSLGLDIFAAHAVTLSLAQRRLIVESASSLAARTKSAKEVPVRLIRETGGTSLEV